MKLKQTTQTTPNTKNTSYKATFKGVVYKNQLHIKLHQLHKKGMIILIV